MRQLSSDQIRQMFLDFFASKGCMIEPGASLVPHDDPTLLWINAGVSALKKYFDGTEKPKSNRICNAQKSIRTNDIENVGKTARHHTFFEMLGNFSIGDYFKQEAIPWAWEFLTSKEWIGFDPERLYVTVYPDDTEAYDLWVKVGMNPNHIRKTDDNFWEIGRGPGGPDTELYYDRGEKYDPEGIGEKLFFEDLENDRYIEVWNIVFSQYDCRPGELPRSEYKELPQKNIDTGMGLERLVCLVQDGETNFDTDLFLPIIRETEKLAKHPYSEKEYKMAYRVIADHIRTVTFALADGALFANEGRGYVLRRVLRRAVRYGIKLGIEGAFMYRLVQTVADNMKVFYPYLESKVEYISKLVKAEELRFHSTLAAGEKLLKDQMESSETKRLDGAVVFRLYDTFGFPFELTKEIAEENGFEVDEEGFKAEMNKQKERARAARADEQSMASQSKDLMDFVEESSFLGYEKVEADAKIIGLFKNGVKVDEIIDEGDIILDVTPFYAESGGQVADIGTLDSEVVHAKVVDVKKAPHKQHLHHVEVVEGTLSLNDTVHCAIDATRRTRIRANHSSAHLLQSALRSVIGNHVHQAGSYLNDEYLRFDFTHFEKVTPEQLRKIEDIVNDWISEKLPVTTEVMDLEEAKKTGAMALFDEKYDAKVRVVTMGDVSKEFCAGTHVGYTSEIGVFKIISEESIGSGIRRITSCTSIGAYKEFLKEEDMLQKAADMLKSGSTSLVLSKLQQLLDEHKALQEVCAQQNQRLLALEASELVQSYQSANGLNVLVREVKDADGNALKSMADNLKVRVADDVTFLYTVNPGKVVFVCHASEAAIKAGFKAGDLVKAAAQICGGNGGGRPDLAQAGGKDDTKVAAAVKEILMKFGL
ncbi:MAG: alanine--tRNA ligase [Erysipelotrichaceae bacterium]|nr:alanine--tRNA ligase [Erysipelotrichaceae bacterium]